MDLTACTEHQCLYKGALYLYFFLSGYALILFLMGKYPLNNYH